MSILVIILLFVIGASFGSFLNVLIMRTVEGEQWVKGRSKCDHCEKLLPWYDNIPLLSYILLRGKSRCCHKQLSLQYPIVEAMTGILFVWWYAIGQVFFQLVESPLTVIQPVYWLVIGLVLVGIFFADWYFGIIPDSLIWIGLVASGGYILVLAFSGAMEWRDVGLSIVSAILAYLFFLGLHKGTRGRGMGYGDVKLAGLEGLILGYPLAAVGVFAGFVVGAIFGVGLIIAGKRKFGQTIPFGPFMVLGIVVALLWGDRIIRYIVGG